MIAEKQQIKKNNGTIVKVNNGQITVNTINTKELEKLILLLIDKVDKLSGGS